MPSIIEQLLNQKQELESTEKEFEHLKAEGYKKTSNFDPKYNCIAFAADETHRPWWPVHHFWGNKDTYWPPELPNICTVQNFINAFMTLGYETCPDGGLEDGFEKVVLFVANKATSTIPKGYPTHMAKQLPSGEWKSKLGRSIDISHKTLKAVEGRAYGVVHLFMKRALK